MIRGSVSDNGTPMISIAIDREDWPAIIDTGFNGDVELPHAVRDKVNARFVGRISSALAGGQTIEEDANVVDFPFDGELFQVAATFVRSPHILIGTRLLKRYDLWISFVSRVVELERESVKGSTK